MNPIDQRNMTNRAVNEALSQLAVAGVSPVDAARHMVREVACQMRAHQGGKIASEALYRLADEIATQDTSGDQHG